MLYVTIACGATRRHKIAIKNLRVAIEKKKILTTGFGDPLTAINLCHFVTGECEKSKLDCLVFNLHLQCEFVIED